jgi:hypothetical protein
MYSSESDLLCQTEAKMNKWGLFPLSLIILLVSGCVGTTGDVIRVTREISNFDQVSLSTVGEVIITQGDQESLTIEAPSNVISKIESEVSGGMLDIRFERGFLPLIPPPRVLRYNLTVREITGLMFSGAGTVNTSGIETERLEVILSGAGNLTIGSLTAETLDVRSGGVGSIDIAGRVTEQDIVLSSVGSYNAGDLQSQTARVKVTGAGRATVWATDALDAEISGVGSVEYYGSPSVTQNVSGVGSVRSLGGR